MSVRDELNLAVTKQMASKLDAKIGSALNRIWTEWSFGDVRRHCQLVGRIGDPIETLYADGVPLLEIHPIEFETVKTQTGWSLKATQNFRHLANPKLKP